MCRPLCSVWSPLRMAEYFFSFLFRFVACTKRPTAIHLQCLSIIYLQVTMGGNLLELSNSVYQTCQDMLALKGRWMWARHVANLSVCLILGCFTPRHEEIIVLNRSHLKREYIWLTAWTALGKFQCSCSSWSWGWKPGNGNRHRPGYDQLVSC